VTAPESTNIESTNNTYKPRDLLEATICAALDRRVLVIVASLLASVAGIWAFMTLKIDAVPDISNVQVTVTTNARGFAPREVEQYVTYPVELALQSAPRLKMQRSISKYALSQVTAIFEDGTDIYFARQQVAERLKQAQDQMPPNADIKMALGPIATGLGEVFQFEVTGPGYSLMQLRDILDWQVIPALKTVPGVDEVQSMGGEAKEYQVWLDPEKMHGYQVTVQEVLSALSRNNANQGGGYTIEQSDQILLRAEGMLKNPEEIEQVVIRRSPQGVIRVRDLGQAVIGKTLSQSIVTQNGIGETAIGIVVMRKGENSKQLVEKVKVKLEEINKTLPINVTTRIFYDRGVLIERTIDTVWHNLMFGAVLVVIVLFALLGSIRGGVIAALSIPLSLFGALIFLTMSGTSANLLSLGALDFGILIDGSVVMVENIIRKLSHGHTSAAQRLNVVKAAACEVASPVLFAVMIITVVYFPILGLPGVSGKTFQPMAITVVFGLLTALAIGLYLTPALSYFILEKKPKEEDSLAIKLVRKPYHRLLLTTVKHPVITFVASLTVFIVSLGLLPLLGAEFIPVLREGSMVLTVNRPVSGSLITAKEQTLKIEKLLRTIPEIESAVSRTGHSEVAFDPMGPDETDVFIILTAPSTWRSGQTQQKIEDEVSKLLTSNVPGLVFTLSQPIEQRMNELVAGARGDVAMRIYGPDLDKLRAIGAQVSALIAPIRGSSQIKLEQTSGLPILTAKLNQNALAAYGAIAQDALDTTAAAVDGKTVGVIFEGRPRYNLTVRFSPDAMKTPEALGDLPVAIAAGNLVPLRQLATISRGLDAAQITHTYGERSYLVQVNVNGRDLGSYVAEAQKTIDAKLVLPPGYRLTWGGQFENMKEAQASLMWLVPLALVMIFLLLYALYNDLRPGLLIFSNIPLAFSGGIFGLLARGMPLSVTAGVGFIALFGVAVLNGVVLVSTIKSFERDYQIKPRQAALLATMQRLRPVLMTALVASLGFVPMALATSVGAEVQRPLATVVICGLATSTILTLLVIPALYPLVCRQGKSVNDI
jgi:cobalt-zinc-cadmium resistance protein CzcA